MTHTKEQSRAWRAANPERVAEYNRRQMEKYHTDQEAKARKVANNARWRKNNRDVVRRNGTEWLREKMKDPVFRVAYNARKRESRGKYPTEASIEKYLCDQVKLLGGMCIKFTDPGRRGAPDRIVCLPGHAAYFVELKRPKLSRLDAHQVRYHDDLRASGQRVWVVWNREEVDAFFTEII